MMCLMTEKQTPYTDGEIQQENKSTVTDYMISDISGCTDQQNESAGLLEWDLTPFKKPIVFPPQPLPPFLCKGKGEWNGKYRNLSFFYCSVVQWEKQRNDKNLTYTGMIKRLLMHLKDKNLASEGLIERILKDFKDKNLTREGMIVRVLIHLQDKNHTGSKMNERMLKLLQGAYDQITIKRTREEKEKKEKIRQLFLMMLLFILSKNIIKNIKCRQTSCRKYPCLNSILYLLWQSGDVEVNPGPANSTTYRNWLYEICSVVRKAIAGVSADCNMYKIWKTKPENWPPGDLYFDPRNSKGLTVNEVEDFLQILIHCCDDTIKLSHEIHFEIATWNSHRSKDNGQLLHLYRTRECRKSTEQLNKSLKELQCHLLAHEVLTIVINTCIRVSVSCQPAIDQHLIINKFYRAEATRKMASYLCIILHGKDPEGKCDNIWTKNPDGWPSDCRYYNPNNGGKRRAKNEDAVLVEALITLCKQKSIIVPKPYQDMVEAWRADNQTLLLKLMTRHTAETDLKKAVMKLHKEGMLKDSEVDKHLRELGLLVQCDESIQNAMSQKRKMTNTMNKHETKKQKQSDHEDAVDTTLKKLLPDCSIGQLLDNQSDSSLLDMISQNIPDFLEDAADDIQFHWP